MVVSSRNLKFKKRHVPSSQPDARTPSLKILDSIPVFPLIASMNAAQYDSDQKTRIPGLDIHRPIPIPIP